MGAFDRLYGPSPLVPWAISEVALAPGAPRLSVLADAFARHGVGHAAFAHGLWLVYLASLGLLLTGLLTRPAAILAWLGHLLLNNGGALTSYGVDYVANVGLFYCAVLPVNGAASLDRFLRRLPPAAPSVVAGIGRRVLRAHLCLVYASSGFVKATGPMWWNGEAIWQAVTQPQFARFDLTWLARAPWLAQGAGLATMAVECGYLFFVWPRATRRLWLVLTVGMHLGIAVFMGLWFFSGVMIALNVAALWEFREEGTGKRA